MSLEATTDIEISKYLVAFKAYLKRQKLTYRVLAERLGMAEVSVKRLCNSSSITLSKLIQLCSAAEWSFTELVASVQEESVEHDYFTDRQDEAFFRYPELLHYFSLLFYEGKSPEAIAKTYGLDDLSTYQYLRELEHIEVLKLGANNTVSFLVRAPIGFSERSRVLKCELVSTLEQTSTAIFEENRENQAFFFIKPLFISKALYRKMIAEIKELISRYSEISELGQDFADQEGYYQIAVGSSYLQQDKEISIPRLSTNHFHAS